MWVQVKMHNTGMKQTTMHVWAKGITGVDNCNERKSIQTSYNNTETRVRTWACDRLVWICVYMFVW